jgi:L-aminopeptidase/D-esterase-like protein
MTGASLDKAQCGRVARAASAGVARAIQPVFTDVDGDTVFCLASGPGKAPSMYEVMQVQTLAARVAAEAIRDAVSNA